jgi:hypothetical protein
MEKIKDATFRLDINDPLFIKFFGDTVASPATLFHMLPDRVLGASLSEYDKFTLLVTQSAQLNPKVCLHLDSANGQLFHSAVGNSEVDNLQSVYVKDCLFLIEPTFHLDILNPGLAMHFAMGKQDQGWALMANPPVDKSLCELLPDRMYNQMVTIMDKVDLLAGKILTIGNRELSIDAEHGHIIVRDKETKNVFELPRKCCAFTYEYQKSMEVTQLKHRGFNQGMENGMSL